MTSRSLPLVALTLAAACSTSSGTYHPGDGGQTVEDAATMRVDAAMPPEDLARPPVDLTVGGSPDLVTTNREPVGAACTSAAGCAGAGATCATSIGGFATPDGYCTASCTTNGNCAGGGSTSFCAQSDQCIASCTGANQCQAWNPDNRCFYGSGVSGACLPSAVSACDPTQGFCPCLRSGYDDVGSCQTSCTLPSNCTGGAVCLYDNATVDQNGSATGDTLNGLICLMPSASPIADGQACTYIEDCVAGDECDYFSAGGSRVCRQLCRNYYNECPGSTICHNAFQVAGFNTTVGATGLCW